MYNAAAAAAASDASDAGGSFSFCSLQKDIFGKY